MSGFDHQLPQDDELNLKDIILSTQDFIREVLRNWKLILLAILICVGGLVANAWLTPVTYPAEMTFMVNEEQGGSVNPLSAIAGQFGFGGGNSGEFNLDKIVELSRSMKIQKAALFEKYNIGGKTDYFINHLIRNEGFHDKWRKDTTGLKDFVFTRGPEHQFNRVERKALKKVFVKVRGNPKEGIKGLVSASYQPETSILSFKAETRKPALSIAFLEEVYDEVSNFYISEAREKPETTFRLLKAKRDSLFDELSLKENQLARAIDSNIGLVSKSAGLKIDRLQRDVQFLTIAYSKVLENTEAAEFSLQNATPFFQVIDHPLRPLRANETSMLLMGILGFILGTFLGVLIIFIRRIYRQTMQ